MVKDAVKQELKLPKFTLDNDGDYYRAVVRGVKICGQLRVKYGGYDSIYVSLYNNQGAGNPIDDCDEMENYSFEIMIEINDVDNQGIVVKDFQYHDITSFSIIKDQRAIAVIDKTRFGQFHKEWTVGITYNDTVQFGCGDVTLSLDQMKMFARAKQLLEDNEIDVDDFLGICDDVKDHVTVGELDTTEIKTLIKKVDTLLETRREIAKPKRVTVKKKK